MHPLVDWAVKREAIRKAKEAGQPRPWTNDPILAEYRFCNVYREYDKVTRWLTTNWRTPHKSDPDLWFAMTVARHLNLPESLAELGYPVPWNAKRFVTVVRKRREQGLTAYNAAYMIRAASGDQFKDKAEYLAKAVFGPLWRKRDKLRPNKADTLESFHTRLQAEYGLGSFMAAQVLADVKFVKPLRNASDWMTFASSGPGSRRGLNRVLGRPVKAPWKEDEWRAALGQLQVQLAPEFAAAGLEPVSASDCQSICCEYDKYERVRLGEGRPKQKYKPGLF